MLTIPKLIMKILLALGSNLGNCQKNLVSAWDQVGKIQGVQTETLSSSYVTEPVGGPKNQAFFFNAAGIVHATLKPEQLLAELQRIEDELGRVRKEHWGPRTIDLDIILFGDKTIRTDSLVIPHPLMQDRGFVLKPANEIAPDMVHPILKSTVSQLWEDWKKRSQNDNDRFA